jgi:hypothetical protein
MSGGVESDVYPPENLHPIFSDKSGEKSSGRISNYG